MSMCALKRSQIGVTISGSIAVQHRCAAKSSRAASRWVRLHHAYVRIFDFLRVLLVTFDTLKAKQIESSPELICSKAEFSLKFGSASSPN